MSNRKTLRAAVVAVLMISGSMLLVPAASADEVPPGVVTNTSVLVGTHPDQDGNTFIYTADVQQLPYVPDSQLSELSGRCAVELVGPDNANGAWAECWVMEVGSNYRWNFSPTTNNTAYLSLLTAWSEWKVCVRGFNYSGTYGPEHCQRLP